MTHSLTDDYMAEAERSEVLAADRLAEASEAEQAERDAERERTFGAWLTDMRTAIDTRAAEPFGTRDYSVSRGMAEADSATDALRFGRVSPAIDADMRLTEPTEAERTEAERSDTEHDHTSAVLASVSALLSADAERIAAATSERVARLERSMADSEARETATREAKQAAAMARLANDSEALANAERAIALLTAEAERIYAERNGARDALAAAHTARAEAEHDRTLRSDALRHAAYVADGTARDAYWQTHDQTADDELAEAERVSAARDDAIVSAWHTAEVKHYGTRPDGTVDHPENMTAAAYAALSV